MSVCDDISEFLVSTFLSLQAKCSEIVITDPLIAGRPEDYEGR